MKRKSFYLLALSALMLSGCSNETDLFGEDPNGGPEGAKQQVTFQFPGTAQGVVPYAGEASVAENEVQTLDVYVFGRDKLNTSPDSKYLLEDVVNLTGGGLVTEGNAKTASITIVGANPKVLYFVANGAGQEELNGYTLGQTTSDDFEKKGTTSLGTGLLKAPLLMTGRYEIPVVDNAMVLTGPHAVTLNRRVARFDITNTSVESTFQIEKILIKGTRSGAYIFSDADVKDKTRTAYAGTVIPKLMELDFTTFTTANMGTTSSVFYVYPTVTLGETSFDLKGLSTGSGEPMVQPVKMQLKQTDTNPDDGKDDTELLPINPNTRYTINVANVGSAIINASITVKEWQVGQEFDVEAGFGLVKMSLETPAAPITGLSLTNSNLLAVPAAALVPAVKILVAADTEWKIEKDASFDWITLGDEPVAGTVSKHFTIATTKNPSSAVRKGVLYIRNVKRPSVVQALIVEQTGSTDGFVVTGDRLKGNTLEAFGTASTNILTLTLPDGVTDFTAAAATEDTWITLKKGPITRSITGDPLQVTVSANDAADKDGKPIERIGKITITIGEAPNALTQTINVKQAAKSLGGIAVNAAGINGTALTYPGTAQTKLALLVSALTEWKVEAFDMNGTEVTQTASTWITSVGENGGIVIKNDKVNYDGQYNFELGVTFVDRKSQVTVFNKVDPTIKSVITIEQKAKIQALSLAGTGYAEDGGKGVLTLTDATSTAAVELTVTTDKPEGTVANLTVAVTDAPTWLAVAAANDKVTVTPTANTETAERTATVTVKMTGASDKTFTVKQAGKAVQVPSFIVEGATFGGSGSALTLGIPNTVYDETTFTVKLTNAEANALTIEQLTGSDWLTFAHTASTNTFKLNAAINPDQTERKATISIKLAGVTDATVITVTQAAALAPVTPVISISDGTNQNIDTYAFAADATAQATANFTASATERVTTGFDVTITMEGGDWLTLDKTSVATNGQFAITVTAPDNSAGTARTATVTVTLANAVAKTFTVTQPGAVI